MLKVALNSQTYAIQRPVFTADPGERVSDVATAQTETGEEVHLLLRRDPYRTTGAAAIVTLTAEGVERARWAPEVLDAHMLCAKGDDVWLVDRDAHRILHYQNRVLVRVIGGAPNAPFNHPASVAVADWGFAVAGGYGEASILLFDRDWNPIHTFGSLGKGPVQFRNPHDVAIDSNGLIYVADRGNDAIKAFDQKGNLHHIFGGLTQPMAVEIGLDGTVYVSDATPTISRFSPQLQLMAQCRPVDMGAHGIAIGAQGHIYMAEPNPAQLSMMVALS